MWESDKSTSPFPADDHKVARNRQDSITKTNMDHKYHNGSTKEAPPWNGQKKVMEGLTMFNGTNITLNSVDQDTQMFGLH